MAEQHRAHTPGRTLEADMPRVPSLIRRVLVLVPCRNEEEGLPTLVASVRAALPALQHPTPEHDREIEVCLLDDASTDATWPRMQMLTTGDPVIHAIEAPRHLNIGGALRYILPRTDADVVVMIDADGTYAPAEIGRLLEAIEAGADVATGSPYHPKGTVEGVPRWRLAISRMLSRIYRTAGHGSFYTYTSMLRAYRRSAISSIHFESDGFLSTAEILVEADRQGLSVVEVPVRLASRRMGQSKMRVAHVVIAHLRYLCRLAFSPRPEVTPRHQSNV